MCFFCQLRLSLYSLGEGASPSVPFCDLTDVVQRCPSRALNVTKFLLGLAAIFQAGALGVLYRKEWPSTFQRLKPSLDISGQVDSCSAVQALLKGFTCGRLSAECFPQKGLTPLLFVEIFDFKHGGQFWPKMTEIQRKLNDLG